MPNASDIEGVSQVARSLREHEEFAAVKFGSELHGAWETNEATNRLIAITPSTSYKLRRKTFDFILIAHTYKLHLKVFNLN